MKVFTSSIVKVKLLLNAFESCYYIMLQDSMQEVASKYTIGFLLLPTITRETVPFSFDFFCLPLCAILFLQTSKTEQWDFPF